MPCCCAPRRSPSSFPFPRLLSDFIVSHLCDRYPLAWLPWTTHRCAVVNKNKFLATSITHAHTRMDLKKTKKKKHVRLHPTFTSHDSQGLLQLTPVPVLECRCWDTCQTEKDFPSAHNSQGHSLTDSRLSWVTVAGGYKVKAGMYSGWQVCYSFMTWSEEILYLEL